ncbi:MAG: AAA family ATPase [Candidatus Aenigmatarchaeota archaeon]
MLVLGLTGPIGAGKDAVSDYLEKEHGFETFSCGDVIRKIAEEEGLEPTRENLQMLGKEYRKKEGKGFLGKKAAEIAENKGSDKLAVNGIRNPEEVEELKKKLGKTFNLIHVKASEETRFRRLKERARPGDPQSFQEFEKQDSVEKDKFNMEETFSMADKEITNEGTMEELYRKVDSLLEKLS